MRTREATMVPPAEVRTYYDRPVLKKPVWKWYVPAYFFTGGLAGASSTLAWAARLRGNDRLGRSAGLVSLGAIAVSPVLLILDLGRPSRFANMLRVAKPTSPMSVGSWLLTLFGPMSGGAAVSDLTGFLPGLGRLCGAGAGLLGPVVATYTAVLTSDTAIPAWHEPWRELPFVFAAGAAASAGAATVLTTAAADAGPARRLAVTAALLEVGAGQAMERRLGALAEPYRSGDVARWSRLATGALAAGAGLVALGGKRRRWASAYGAALVLAGTAFTRWSIFRAGFVSAEEPRYTVAPQRQRLSG